GGGWVAMNSGVSIALHGVWGSGPNDVYAVGDGGTVLHYDGNPAQDWAPVATGVPPAGAVRDVWGSGPNDVFILANDGLDLVQWNGTAWRTVLEYSPSAGVWMYTLWGTGPRNVYAAGDVGTILHGER
ncbi:MAG TPA: hypothetical protein VFJ16_24740, partial [Longimicrobium sp.]|nr:hypothetical protein [Longimicrobium sp.]